VERKAQPPERSIAVPRRKPQQNREDFVADGVQDDVLTKLGNAGLKVSAAQRYAVTASRTARSKAFTYHVLEVAAQDRSQFI